MSSCDRPASPSSTLATTTLQKKPNSGYSLKHEASWERYSPSMFGKHTDLALVRDGCYFTVIVEDSAEASLAQFTKASLEAFKLQVQDFNLLRQVEISLDGQPGVTIFANGEIKNHLVHYSITYVVHQGRRYQLVAWTDPSRAQKLALDVDALISGWQFVP